MMEEPFLLDISYDRFFRKCSQYDSDFLFRPRATIEGFVYFPEAGDAVDIDFQIFTGETGFPPFFQQRVENTGAAGTVVPFAATGTVSVGRIPPSTTVVFSLGATAVNGGPFTVFLPGSLHVDFNPVAIPEPSTAAMLGLGAALLVWSRRRRGICSQLELPHSPGRPERSRIGADRGSIGNATPTRLQCDFNILHRITVSCQTT
jgi:hypothetical protein